METEFIKSQGSAEKAKACGVIIPLAMMIAGALIAGAIIRINPAILAGSNSNNNTEKLLTIEKAEDRAVSFINENMLQEGATASVIESAEESGIYRIKLKIQEDEFDLYITKDGRFLFPQFIDIEEFEKEKQIVKADRPDVKIFVMSHCPYGLQAEKMFLPVYELLKDEADMGIYYVDYIMHGKQEIDENLRQYCIELEQGDKYYNYLNCFVYNSAGDAKKCLAESGVDETRLDACIARVDQEFKVTAQYNDKSTWRNGLFPKFDLHADLNQKYDVKGSPTIVINGKRTEVSPRSPENFKNIVCEAFNAAPEQCSQTLSEEVPAPGFGSGKGGSSNGECK